MIAILLPWIQTGMRAVQSLERDSQLTNSANGACEDQVSKNR